MPVDATALALAIRRGEMSAKTAMDGAIAAATTWEAPGKPLGALCFMDESLGRDRAAAFDARPPSDPQRATVFAGVPTLVKDLGAPFAGLPARAGSAAVKRAKGSDGSDLSARFDAAGLLPFGLTTSPEFGLSLASEPAIGPIARNPLDLSLSPGGSSGGAAAAVAAGIVAIAHATDAGGSIRVPAAACGLIGLKPGRGSVPGGPGFGNHLGGIASELAVCRSVRDAAAMFETVFAAPKLGPYAEPALAAAPKTACDIGVLLSTGCDFPTDPARLAAVEAAARLAEQSGHRIHEIAWDEIAPLARESAAGFAAIVRANLATWADAVGFDMGQLEPISAAVIDEGRAMSATALWRMLDGAVHVSYRLGQIFNRFDALLTPMLSTAPKPIGSFPTDHRDTELHFNRMTAFAPLAALANIGGIPAIALPFGTDEAGLPLTVQILGPMGQERLLLALAATLELDNGWSHRFPLAHPPIFSQV